jgi:hypothetical protein
VGSNPTRAIGGVAQLRRALACQARGRRFDPGRPRSWWPWCKGPAPEVVSLAVPVRVRSVTPKHADAEQRRAQRAVTPPPRAVVVRLHPSAPRGCSSTGRAPCLQRGRCRFDSDRLHPPPWCERQARALCTAEVRVRLLPEALRGPWCNGSTASSNLAGPGSTPGGPVSRRSSRAGAARLPGQGVPSARWPLAVRLRTRPRLMTATSDSTAGRRGSGYLSLQQRRGLTALSSGNAGFRSSRREMHLHLVRVAARPKPVERPKVVRLEDRRKARLGAARRDRPRPPRPAA